MMCYISRFDTSKYRFTHCKKIFFKKSTPSQMRKLGSSTDLAPQLIRLHTIYREATDPDSSALNQEQLG